MVFHKDPRLRVHQYERENSCRTLPAAMNVHYQTQKVLSTFLFTGSEPMQQMHANHAQATTFPSSSSCFQVSTSATECSSYGSLTNWSKQVHFWLKHRKDKLHIKSSGCPLHLYQSRDAEYVIVHWASQTGGFKATSSSVYLYRRTRRKTTPSTYTHPSTVEPTSAATAHTTITAEQNTHDRLLGEVMRLLHGANRHLD